MTERWIPIVVLIPEDVLPLIHERADAATDTLAGWADLKAKNGWTDEAITAGSILANTLRAAKAADLRAS